MPYTIQYDLNWDDPHEDKKRLVSSRVSRKQKNNYTNKMKATRKERGSSNFQFASIVNGEFHIKVDPGTEGSVKRTNKNGIEVDELIYNEVSDLFFKALEVAETDFGKQLKVMLMHADNKDKYFVINVPLNSGYAKAVLNRAMNIDLGKTIEAKVFDIENKAGDKVNKTRSITIYQNGEKVEQSWTKDNNPVPKVLPINDAKGKQRVKNGYPQWDYSLQELFLETYVNETVTPHLNSYWMNRDTTIEKTVGSTEALEVDAVDDLGF